MKDLRKVVLKKEISIFRTSVNSEDKIEQLKSLLNIIIGSDNWSFDLEDCDNVLRVNYYSIMNNFLIEEIHKMGFECIGLFRIIGKINCQLRRLFYVVLG